MMKTHNVNRNNVEVTNLSETKSMQKQKRL